jgi:hypothetical protein
VSARDKRIFQLREEENVSFKIIADKIITEFNIDNSDGKVNEDSVKTAYRRARAKILSFSLRSKRNI